jgi:class 3 adenylate cyclase/tetratricopeptide (TPR) repeat protein
VTTENLAILFTDIVGSTELSQQLSPALADDVRRQHFSLLRQAIAEFGGTEVKNLGDGLMVVFGSASAALSCGVAMQQHVELDNRGRQLAVGLRVGVSGGEVSREDDDYFGDPVIEAARLCALCEKGKFLAAELVRLMAGRRSHHEYRSLGEIDLKGLLDPVTTVEVLWEPLAGSGHTVPLPVHLERRPTAGLVGRAAETQIMADAGKRVFSGEGREVQLVSGEAGMGKTTLVAEVARLTFDSGACVLFGHSEEDLATPYQHFAEALGHYVTHAPEDLLLAHVEVHGSELVRLVPALASRIPDLPPSKATDTDSERYLLFAAVVNLLAEGSALQPIVLVLDDLQWADNGSLLLLRHLVAAEQSMRMLVLGTFRDAELSNAHPLRDTLAALHRQQGIFRIHLAGLDDTGVVELMEAIAGYTLDDAAVSLAHAVYRETDGNPFFVDELLRHLSETGAIFQDQSGRWVAEGDVNDIGLPASVREVIGARTGRLGGVAERVLSLAAVIGRDFDLDVLERAATLSEDELLAILDAAASAALVRELADTPGRFSFAHALIQHTLYEDLGPNRRARAHRQVAAALEDLCGDKPGARVGELARHWTAATLPADLVKAIDYSRQAGDAALSALAPDDALRYYTQALELFAQADDPDPSLRIDLGIGLGTSQRQTGNPHYRETLLDAARRAADFGDIDRLISATLANDRGLFSSTGIVDEDRVDLLNIALARLPAGHPDRALVLATLCKELVFGSVLERRQTLGEEAIAIAMSLGDDAAIVRVLNNVSQGLQTPSLVERAQAWTADALARAERLGDPLLLFFAATRRSAFTATAGDIEEMDRCLEIMAAVAEQLNQPTLRWLNTLEHATRVAIAGDTDRAEQLATEALQIGTDGGEPDAASIFGAQLLTVSFQRGQMGDLAPLVEQVAADNPGNAHTAMAVLAAAHAEGGRTDDAHRQLEELAAVGYELPLDMLWTTGMTMYAEAAIECRDSISAQPIFDQLAPWEDRLSYSGAAVEGPVSHYLGGLATILGRYAEADDYFAKAAAMNERIGAKFFAARTDLKWGELLIERKGPGDTERARELLTMAHSAAVTHGYGTVERRSMAAIQDLNSHFRVQI